MALRLLARPAEEEVHRIEGGGGACEDSPREARLTFGADVIFEPHKKAEPPPAPLLFGEYFGRWLDSYAKQACKESTWKSYSRDFRLYLKPIFGEKPLAGIRREDVRVFLAELRERRLTKKGREGQKLALGTIKNTSRRCGAASTRPSKTDSCLRTQPRA